MKYRVEERIVACDETIEDNDLLNIFTFTTPNLIGYKITAGLSIFYITADVYKQGIDEGIIEPITSDITECDYSWFLTERGYTVNKRMKWSLMKSTLPYLKKELERINGEAQTVEIKVYKTSGWWKDGKLQEVPVLSYNHVIIVDLKNRKIVLNTATAQSFKFDNGFYGVDTYSDFLECFAKFLDCKYQNVPSFYKQCEKSKFYSVDNWNQKIFKFEFCFEVKRFGLNR